MNMRYYDKEELMGLFHGAMNWMSNSRGRYFKLVAMRAPIGIVANERSMWDRMIGRVRDILADGRVELSHEGRLLWRGLLEEYAQMPTVAEVLARRR